MRKQVIGLAVVALAFFPLLAHGQSKPVLVVHAFSVGSTVAWPYDGKQLQTQTVAELKAKPLAQFDVVAEAPSNATAHVYTLDGEVLSWQAGNRAKRLVVGLGSGRETSEIRYRLTDEKGSKIFEHKDTIRAEFIGNAYAGSVGQLAHPFASKIADRLNDVKLTVR